jgi:transposase
MTAISIDCGTWWKTPFLKLKGWRAIATRHLKNAASYLAAVQIRCLYLWLAIS